MVNQNASLRWKEVYALSALSAAIAISWIAYHEYQPHLLESFEITDLGAFLIVSKGIVLVLVPPLAGLLSDYMMRKKGKTFLVYSVGIGLTAMVFMGVASILGAGPVSGIRGFLPYMIVIWLVAMNIFNSPALSMIDSFAPAKNLPIVVGFLFFITEIIYALEPVIVELVRFLGETLTFITGGILIAATGYIFFKTASENVFTHRESSLSSENKSIQARQMGIIILLGLVLGAGNAFVVEFIPDKAIEFMADGRFGAYFSFGLLGLAALLAFSLSRYVTKVGFEKFLLPCSLVVIAAIGLLLLSNGAGMFITASILLALGFGLLNISALPYAISRLPVRIITFGIGIFLGASYIVEGILEYQLQG